ncbi:MAG TPA: sulfur carrier protein ThiS [Methylibium sp.]|uniref:sulfur carrier protein ThiS n=1 Tax=Methylibium sp. TaxID=2067992 RepID=UPI002DBBFCD7|nr:sulfur carrier protein ThiS [Methylibium sp.]HEU4460069.1 sulfur carrier protein ThiS [Methylibium sp.]
MDEVRINDRAVPWREGLDLAQALDALGIEAGRVATALNGDFVARERRAATLLAPGDAVAVFATIVGG